MYLISKLFQAAQSWRRRGGAKTAKRSAVDVEQLDHRQLLSVNFTGNVATDFPATKSPGVVIFNSSNTPGIISCPTHRSSELSFQPRVTPFRKFAVSYDSADDTLSVGFERAARRIPLQSDRAR